MKKIIVCIALLLSSSYALAEEYNTEVSYGGYKQESKIDSAYASPIERITSYPVAVTCLAGKFKSLNSDETASSFTTKQSVVKKSGYSEYSVSGKLKKFNCDSGVSFKNFTKTFKVYDNESFNYIDPERGIQININK